jgi:hypothetical protein
LKRSAHLAKLPFFRLWSAKVHHVSLRRRLPSRRKQRVSGRGQTDGEPVS